MPVVPVRHPRDRGRDWIVLAGDPPSPVDPPASCRFHTHCPLAADVCRERTPTLDTPAEGHAAACHFAPANI
ncbi:oligopeptide/dipeptide ABC transporter, ATP-binding protein, C-terminal domain-containing protein [Micromonospora rhizosphaerae]|uniref:Oligopeptide/dipeptide ABC transporter, ATP-binding protein, C-terminal domain-containing protein n=1 Tax=Micromonospora rhizosphaerae TaxID=568872 RepID=A0A1C6SBH7_9ACTN|nr:oligopeptide/dipeptide ABC transporter ATP-binding protein [Micromonospora rhizosphaerae]SCL26691.1 oligopeptide/dipeptide ABC transporter, ATP-binding protein, C-terminal domain-containing protein [Micromonospora rhizosphaerae]